MSESRAEQRAFELCKEYTLVDILNIPRKTGVLNQNLYHILKGKYMN